MKQLPADQVALGDQIELPSGLVGEVFSAIPSGGSIPIYIEAKGGGMQSHTYSTAEPVKVIQSQDGKVVHVKDLKVGDTIAWGAKSMQVLGFSKPASQFKGDKQVDVKYGNGRTGNIIQNPNDQVRLLG